MEILGLSLSDDILATAVPIVVFWLYSGICMLLLGSLENYRLHSKKDEDEKNSVTMGTVIKGVLLVQTIQIVVNIILFNVVGSEPDDSNRKDSLISLVKQILIAIVVQDTWNYFMHRFLHLNKFMYRHIHSLHHQMIVSYPFGAMFVHPIEGLILDTTSGVLTVFISGMSPRTSLFFFSIVTMKNINDHCGLLLPGNLFNVFLENGTVFHDCHHQLYGTKFNFSAPYLVIWDRLLGTYMASTVEKKVGGGFKARPSKVFKDNSE